MAQGNDFLQRAFAAQQKQCYNNYTFKQFTKNHAHE
jgi:hypothetical protein